MSKSITCNLFSTMEMEKKLGEYLESVLESTKGLTDKLAEDGARVADEKFTIAAQDPEYKTKDGQVHFKVTYKTEGNTSEIIAKGRDVAFLEAGTGVWHTPYSSSALPAHGTYGHGRGRLRYDKQGNQIKRWVFSTHDVAGGKHRDWSTGNEPAEAMTGAVQHIVENYERIVREVLSHE